MCASKFAPGEFFCDPLLTYTQVCSATVLQNQAFLPQPSEFCDRLLPQKNTFMKKNSGFTLVELLVALAIIGIFASIAYPAYESYITKIRRTEAQVALMDLAARMEHFYSENQHSYSGADLGALGVKATTPKGYYRLSLSNLSSTTYTLEAKPIGVQAGDTICKTLTLNQLGQKGKTGSGTVEECW
jgi:type IV pilus assembly protein PilE